VEQAQQQQQQQLNVKMLQKLYPKCILVSRSFFNGHALTEKQDLSLWFQSLAMPSHSSPWIANKITKHLNMSKWL